MVDPGAIERTRDAARDRLLALRRPDGRWEGRLSSSALSTATAVCALEIARRRGGPESGSESDGHAALIARGVRWLLEHANPDGGYGDTVECPSNLSTTTLVWAALSLFDEAGAAAARTERWLERSVGEVDAESLTTAISARYGVDRTFSVPILTMCAIAGRFGEGAAAWRVIPRLPFELAALPRSWFRRLGLPVVSYALPALIAIGQAQHRCRPTRNPVARVARAATRGRTLRVLEAIQPESGGFLEAAPLTGFVAMSLAAAGEVHHPVTRKALAFLADTVREDGSWPIDVDLSTWVTSLSIQALAAGGRLEQHLAPAERAAARTWLLARQMRVEHRYTGAPPGGWAWTDRSGGVPDADDTPGALLALSLLGGRDDPEVRRAAIAGTRWLLGLQNQDGGIPTFCRGWGKLPFDRSSPDLTAHVLRAWSDWREALPDALARRVGRAARRARRYLLATQRSDGSWLPLWFGNPWCEDEMNPVYGTSRVLQGAGTSADPAWRQALERAADWLRAAQNPDGGFGGGPGVASSIEETALAADALAAFAGADSPAVARAGHWLVHRTAEGARFEARPIGLYFAKLWYSERLYPLIFTVSALERTLVGSGSDERPGA